METSRVCATCPFNGPGGNPCACASCDVRSDSPITDDVANIPRQLPKNATAAEEAIKKIKKFIVKKTRELKIYAQHAKQMEEEEANDPSKWEKYEARMEEAEEIVTELRKILKMGKE